MIRAVLFDLGRTLVGDPRPEAWEALRRSEALPLGVGGPALVEALIRADAEVDSPEFSHFLGERAIATRALEVLGRPTPPADVESVFEAYLVAALHVLRTDPKMAPVQGPRLEQLLRELRSIGVERLGIVSNERQTNAVTYLAEVLGVQPDTFDVILTAETAGVGKPDPKIFQIALDRIGIHPSDAIYVGDSLDLDALPARAAGLTPVLVTALASEGGTSVPPDVLVLDDLSALVLLVGRLNAVDDGARRRAQVPGPR